MLTITQGLKVNPIASDTEYKLWIWSVLFYSSFSFLHIKGTWIHMQAVCPLSLKSLTFNKTYAYRFLNQSKRCSFRLICMTYQPHIKFLSLHISSMTLANIIDRKNDISEFLLIVAAHPLLIVTQTCYLNPKIINEFCLPNFLMVFSALTLFR